MKKIIYKTIQVVCVAGLLAVSACNTFESEPLEWNTEANVTNPADSTAVNVKRLFYAVYASLPSLHTRISNSYLDAATDDGVPTRDKGGSSSLENYRNGAMSPENIASLDGAAWKNFYIGIRRANLLLETLEGYPSSTKLPKDEIVRMKSESRLLRAYFYFELVKRWGGVPLLGDKIFNYDEDWNIARSSLDECVKYILDEISKESPTSCYDGLSDVMAIPSEELTGTVGRVNKGVALALIARLKLYLASPLYNSSNNLAKWQEAANAAKAVMDLGEYDLHYTASKGADDTTEPTPGLLDLFGNNDAFPNRETIMMKESSGGTTLENDNSPCGYQRNKCKGLTSPSQNLVDAFLMLDGKSINDPTSKYTYDEQKPYENRDPRLTYTVFYNGATWLKRPVETFNGGLDRSNKPGMFTTQTGYYLRKFLGLNETRNDNSDFNGAYHHYQIIRYAEILLNYVEALNEADMDANKTEIEKYLIQLRTRAGIEEGDDKRYGLPSTYTQGEMRKIIRNERRIELAFEEHRFWDIRRWMIADRNESVMTKPIRGVEIIKQADGSFYYNYVDVCTSTFEERMYWYPIPRGEMQGNTKLTQNPGWNY
ncbi:RagB/SusD family nutrient uptake outer membrane protein [Bacteroides sp. GM023]|uniref:RagB/SusD family nutrient uptake outer membrane protein n=1 Tax=Bacteroides sp. GM023 TaxID=2723058 RepID=UPI00168B193A|nr:RagB/SusD family nutrient uptake outer membrane protein [Bacteroides sp. GM023]MBD3588382.1 RagB/SusD family nutrient uptake outer membrane protein [Bacteroides sp. GM023]